MNNEELKAKVLAGNLRMVADKIENGYPVNDEQKNMIETLTTEIFLMNPNKYTATKRLYNKEEENER